MVFRTLKIAGSVFLFFLMVHAQEPAKKIPTGSIGGKVTVKGKGIAGIIVGARPMNPRGRPTPAVTGVTDEQGNYRIANVPAGEYEIMPAAPQFVLISIEPMKILLLSEGESVDDVNFRLVRGGVITGKVVDAEGRPVIEEHIQMIPTENVPMAQLNQMFHTTDDRGIYRIYGLPPGKYKVSAGASEEELSLNRGGRAVYTKTFHPSTPDMAQATEIQVTEGGEATNVDITLRRSQPTYTVSAKIVDADTGQPVANARLGLQKYSEHGSTGTSGPASNGQGEVRIENVTPGKYSLFLAVGFMSIRTSSGPAPQLYAEPLKFEVTDHDVTGLVLKTSSGSGLSGVVLFEGANEKTLNAKLNELFLFAHVQPIDRRPSWGAPTSPVNADGSFTVSGLQPGIVAFSIISHSLKNQGELDVVRIERDGAVLPRLEVKEREQIKGLRLILKWRTGQIRGVVKFENEQFRSLGSVYVNFKKEGDEAASTVQLDERGRFQSGPLASGVYEVSVIAYFPRSQNGPFPSAKQQVVVNDNQVTEVTLTLEVKPETTDRP